MLARTAFACVVIAAALPTATRAQTWTVAETRRVGPDGPQFGAITDVALDSTGRLWIADGMSGELYVAEGEAIRRVAAAGPGPGELEPGPLEVVVVPGDTVLVFEPHGLRFHVFSPDGTHLRTVRITGEPGMTEGWRTLPDGRLAARLLPATVVLPDAAPGVDGDPVRVFARDGRAAEVRAVLPPMEGFRMGPGPLPIITLLAPQPVWDVDARGRVLVASTHAYEVRTHAPDGAVSVLVSGNAKRGRIAGDMADRARSLLRDLLQARGTPRNVVDHMVAGAGIAETAPVLGGLMAGPGGTVWIRDAATAAEDLVDLQRPGGRIWRVHDDVGRPLGSATMPAGFQPVEWRGDLVAGIGRDDLDRTYALVLRVSPAHR